MPPYFSAIKVNLHFRSVQNSFQNELEYDNQIPHSDPNIYIPDKTSDVVDFVSLCCMRALAPNIR